MSFGACAIEQAIRPIRLAPVDALEVRRLLTVAATYSAHTASDLISDINSANSPGGNSTINLDPGATYDFTAADNDWYGPNPRPGPSSSTT